MALRHRSMRQMLSTEQQGLGLRIVESHEDDPNNSRTFLAISPQGEVVGDITWWVGHDEVAHIDPSDPANPLHQDLLNAARQHAPALADPDERQPAHHWERISTTQIPLGQDIEAARRYADLTGYEDKPWNPNSWMDDDEDDTPSYKRNAPHWPKLDKSAPDYGNSLQERRQALVSGMTIQPHPRRTNGVVAVASDGRRIGHLDWKPLTQEIDTVTTHPELRRLGVASAMRDYAKSGPAPELHHSNKVSHRGYLWAKSDPEYQPTAAQEGFFGQDTHSTHGYIPIDNMPEHGWAEMNDYSQMYFPHFDDDADLASTKEEADRRGYQPERTGDEDEPHLSEDFDDEGYNEDGYSRHGYDRDGYDVNDVDSEGWPRGTRSTAGRIGHGYPSRRQPLRHRSTLAGETYRSYSAAEGLVEPPSSSSYSPPVGQRAASSRLAEVDPEDYRITHRAPTNYDDESYGGPFHDPQDILPDIHAHPEWYDGDAETNRQLLKTRGNPNAPVTIYRAQSLGQGPGGKSMINPGDWTTPSKAYAMEHFHAQKEGQEFPWGVVKATVPASHLWGEGYAQEWGYSPDHKSPIEGQVIYPRPKGPREQSF